MQSGLSESLAGRFETIRVSHWSFAEMSAAFGFDLPQYLYFGGYPGAAPLVREPDRWRAYILGGLVEPNIERDLLAMTRVDKPALLKRLFDLGADCSGQILAYNKMLGQLHDAGNTTTLARYLDLLASAGLLAGLQKYTGGPASTARLQPQAQRAQHRPDDGWLGVLLRGGAGRPHLLGPHRRERGGRAPVQHRRVRYAPPLLAGRGRRGRTSC